MGHSIRKKLSIVSSAVFLTVFMSCADGNRTGDGNLSGLTTVPSLIDDWINPLTLLAASDGSCSLGDVHEPFNSSRDQGSKIAYFDLVSGNNSAAEIYWFNGTKIVDSNCSTTNPTNGQEYGTNPLEPNENAIQPFATFQVNFDHRLRTQQGTGSFSWRYDALAGGYPDFFLFKRGQDHQTFDMPLGGGRSEEEPMVVASYGPEFLGRAVFNPNNYHPLNGHNWGEPEDWLHVAIFSLEIGGGTQWFGLEEAESSTGNGPVTMFMQDCLFTATDGPNLMNYPPKKSTIFRSIFIGAWSTNSHSQGYFTSKYENEVLFDSAIFYRSGFKEDPFAHADPRRTIFDRNIYQGGGAQMGHTYRNILSIEGGSGSPQMRLGGRIEKSFVLEGYWYSSTMSNSPENTWLFAQTGPTAIVKSNVQQIYAYPNPIDPDTPGLSDSRAHPGWGFTLQGASMNADVEDNIITGAMLDDDLGWGPGLFGIELTFDRNTYQDGNIYVQHDNLIRNNILYRVRDGLRLNGDGTGINNIVFEGNVVFAENAVNAGGVTNLSSVSQVEILNNRFYTSNQTMPTGPYIGTGNVIAGENVAAASEGWSDPNRTLKRYVQEVLGLTLLDWTDDPRLDANQASARQVAGEEYDPTGAKTFMMVATQMRKGGTIPIPTVGKPVYGSDYPWDLRFEAKAVVNWIREGFGRPPVN